MGMLGVYSMIPFKALLDAGANIVGVVTPRPMKDKSGPKFLPPIKPVESNLPVLTNPVQENIQALASQHDIPVMSVGSLRDAASLAALEEMQPDLVITVCFPRILPHSWLETPKFGCLNLHPSLLPAYRGPYPLFWQFRAGETNMGVTLHIMDVEVDAGDILGQKKVEFPEGITAAAADKLAAQAGAELILQALSQGEVSHQPQGLEGASYQSAPTWDDRTIGVDWEVKRAFNFLRGADEWAPFWVRLPDGEEREIKEAIFYQAGKKNSAVLEDTAEGFEIQLADGVLLVR